MSQLLGMSFDSAASPSISLRPWQGNSEDAVPSGWGFGWYPSDYAAVVMKDPFSTGDTALSRVLHDWERFRGTVFVCHMRGAAKRVTQQDTHPFCYSLGGRNFLLSHNGTLASAYRTELPIGDEPVYDPIGRTDSEWAFCWLLTQLRGYGARRLADMGWPRLLALFERLNSLGTANVLLSDGQDLVAYRDVNSFSRLHVRRRIPPHQERELSSSAMTLTLADPLDYNRSVVLFTTSPLGSGFRMMEPGEMVVARGGALTWTSHPDAQPNMVAPEVIPAVKAGVAGAMPPYASFSPASDAAAAQQVQTQSLTGLSQVPPTAPMPVAPAVFIPSVERSTPGRVMRVVHETVYTYEEPVERSTHVFRLRPTDDVWQDVLEYRLDVTPNVPGRDFEDVFGNAVRSMKIDTPYRELNIRSEALLRIRVTPPIASIDRRSTIPLVWMPWQRQMMTPYLLPPELPETQLRELNDFAMSFVERQDYNLVDTIHDLNRSIYKDFSYVSGSTTLSTTPFDVYVERRGVCQDFANLFICLTRLLGLPARYRVGYIHTGANYENKIQSEASHAWAEVYLPWIGWRGFDPTNGCGAHADHIRVATGRNYRDAAPTQGTLFKGGTKETLSVDVRVQIVEDDPALVAHPDGDYTG